MYRPSHLGTYDIATTLAHGPSHSLYLGKARAGDQQVVIRIWRAPHTLSREERERIEQECAALATLQHPALLPLLETYLAEQDIAVVRAYVPGPSLHTRLATRSWQPLPLEDALDIILQVGAALQAAHEQGITHGRVTPHNVLFLDEGHARLSDFRIGSVLAVLGESAGESAVLRRYMAPEQFQGECSPAADQYALGCLAYELLTGHAPFAGLARATLLQKHHSASPTPPCLLNPAIPSHIERAVLTALAKTPDERYPTLQTFLESLAGSGETVVSLPVVTVPADVSQPDPPPDTAARPECTRREQDHRQDMQAGTLSPPVYMVQARHHQQKDTSPRLILVLTVGLILLCIFSVWLVAPFGRHGDAPAISSPTTGAVTLVSPTVVLSPTFTPLAWPTPRLAATSQSSPSSMPSPQPTVLPSPAPGSVYPVFECVIRQGGTAYLARFGYVNATSSVVTIPVGSENALSPGSVNGSQPTIFSPGTQSDALQVGIPKGEIAWSLDGSTVTATFHGPHC